MSRPWSKIRAGLEDHLVSGSIGAFEAGVYLILHLQADFHTGIWTGSANRLLSTAPRGASLRDMQRALQRLGAIGFIRTFHRHGERGNYRVLINKYEPQFGALRGKRLNAEKSTSWQSPAYEPCALADAVTDAVTDAEDAPYQEVRVRTKTKKTPKASAQANHQPSPLAFSGEHLRVTERLDRILAEAFPWVNRQAEYRIAESWAEGNPGKRPRNFSRFMHNWFARVDRPSNGGNGGRNGFHRGNSSTQGVKPEPGKYDGLRVVRGDA